MTATRIPHRKADGEAGLASSMIAFLVAGVLFIGSIAAILLTTRQAATGSAAATVPQADLRVQAESLAQVLVMSPGYTDAQGDWVAGGVGESTGATPLADQVRRLGLRNATSDDPLMMSFDKFHNLRRAPYDANSADGYVNYPEARAGFGLDDAGLDFHVRAFPALEEVQEMLKRGYKDPNLRVTYIGDIDVTRGNGQPADPDAGLVVGTPWCGVSPLTSSPDPQAYRLSVNVTNGGITTTQFNALVEYELGGSAEQSQNANSYRVAPEQTVVLFVDVPATSGISCTVGSEVGFKVSDPASVTVEVAAELATAHTDAAAAPQPLWLDTTKPYFTNPTGATSDCDEKVKLNYDGPPKNDWVYLEVKNATSGVVVYVASQKVPASSNQRNFDAGCHPAGEYLGTLYYCGSSSCSGGAGLEQVVERALVVTAAPDPYTPTGGDLPTGPDAYASKDWSRKEVEFLHSLVTKFCPTYFDSKTESPLNASVAWGTWDSRCKGFKTSQGPQAQPVQDLQPGDVFPDTKPAMNDDLPTRLVSDPDDCNSAPRYDIVNVLVAGSTMDQTAMTSAQAKQCVATWVLGGGTLLVFGSDNQNVNWLEPIFHAAIRSSSGGISTPDPGHPLLNTPDALDYPEYDNHGQVWNFNGQTAQNAATLFNNVVLQGTDPVTTRSNPGAMGNGSIILTSWQPYRLNDTWSGDAARFEGLKLVNNMLSQSYRDLYLDYGPALPARANVQPAVARVHIQHPQFDEPILLDLSVYVFPSG